MEIKVIAKVEVNIDENALHKLIRDAIAKERPDVVVDSISIIAGRGKNGARAEVEAHLANSEPSTPTVTKEVVQECSEPKQPEVDIDALVGSMDEEEDSVVEKSQMDLIDETLEETKDEDDEVVGTSQSLADLL